MEFFHLSAHMTFQSEGCQKGAERVPKGCQKGAKRVPLNKVKQAHYENSSGIDSRAPTYDHFFWVHQWQASICVHNRLVQASKLSYILPGHNVNFSSSSAPFFQFECTAFLWSEKNFRITECLRLSAHRTRSSKHTIIRPSSSKQNMIHSAEQQD